jgi:lipopolysaccharide biosynthesis regulator YciM
MGLVIWGFVFLLIAIVVAAIGWFSGKRARKKLDARESSVATD